MVAALCLLSGVTAQRGNYVDEGAFDYAEPAPPQRAAPRPAPAYRPTSSLSAAPRPTPVPILKQINR
ncbi:hypothetical protein J6590_059176 [Homalodisca vitripennis]|nr:hypothetical protein J6590_059176 [Homalodisca vitripennis]